MKQIWLVALVLAVLVNGSVTVAFAEEEPVAGMMAQKAVRGVANMGLGVVVEVPKTIYYDTLEDGPVYGLTVGVLEGLSWGIARTLTGLYEVVTFPFPVLEGHRPIYKPSYPFEAGKTDLAD
ncbi:MAG: exosortase system-associated protein, TIGR04073 family [candidate division NC10 bacterium]|nr:exosortase system-associated protein, TIGR04073 family [candidate division NC10 bacterium]MDE2320494.1 exosortase system-associated protein, TIGR04073 family [candidate division NC10 bacterium]